jgi:hypothetical protein
MAAVEKDELISMLRKEARQAGIPDSEAVKAARLLRKGKIDMGRLAPQIANAFKDAVAPSDPRSALRKKLQQKRESRTSKAVLENNYERMREQVKTEREKAEAQKASEKMQTIRRNKRHRRKLRELEEQLGNIDIETYLAAMRRIKDNTYADPGDKCRDSNIIELYGKQQSFKEMGEMEEMEDMEEI